MVDEFDEESFEFDAEDDEEKGSASDYVSVSSASDDEHNGDEDDEGEAHQRTLVCRMSFSTKARYRAGFTS